MSTERIALLSQRILKDFSPPEFKAWVKSLFYVKVKKASVRKAAAPFSWSLTKKGNLSIRMRRKPKWISRAEIEAVAKESGKSQAEVWNYCTSKKQGMRISSAEEEAAIEKNLSDMPF